MPESLLDFVKKNEIIRPVHQFPKEDFLNPYWFLNHLIGYHNQDFSIFKLIRTRKNFTTRKYPNHTQVSRSVILDLLYRRKTRKILIEIDGIIKYYTTPVTWLNYGIVDKLSPDQEDQLFLAIKFLHEVKHEIDF